MNNTYIQQSTAGTTVTSQDTGQNVLIVHETINIATLTWALPATPVDGQTARLCSAGGVIALTITSPFAGSTIVTVITAITAGTVLEFTYVKNLNKWYKSI